MALIKGRWDGEGLPAPPPSAVCVVLPLALEGRPAPDSGRLSGATMGGMTQPPRPAPQRPAPEPSRAALLAELAAFQDQAAASMAARGITATDIHVAVAVTLHPQRAGEWLTDPCFPTLDPELQARIRSLAGGGPG